MLTRAELKAFQKHRHYPSVSILAPTHRTAPLRKQDRIKVKNLVAEAIDRLHKEFTKREVAPLVKSLKDLARKIDWRRQQTLCGLALFASEKQSVTLTTPFSVKPRVVIHETFASRDLVYAYNRTPPYRVVVLGDSSRLYDAWKTTLDERREKPFPVVHRGPGGAAKLPGGPGVNISGRRDAAHRAYFRSVDEAVAAVQKSDPLPLILVGVERALAFYQEVTDQSEMIVGMLSGNHEKTSPSDLGKLVWPVFEAADTLRRTKAIVQLDAAVDASRHASGIAQVWREAAQAMVRILLVEKDLKYPADVSADGNVLTKYTGGKESLDDAVDELIERVLDTGGEVYFYSPGDLGVHQKVAAVLRR